MSARRNLPGGGRGIELHTPSRMWLLCPASEEEFALWLSAISRVVSANVRRIQARTGDDELFQDLSQIDLSRIDSQTRALLETGEGFVGGSGGGGGVDAADAVGFGSSRGRTSAGAGSDTKSRDGDDVTAGALSSSSPKSRMRRPSVLAPVGSTHQSVRLQETSGWMNHCSFEDPSALRNPSRLFVALRRNPFDGSRKIPSMYVFQTPDDCHSYFMSENGSADHLVLDRGGSDRCATRLHKPTFPQLFRNDTNTTRRRIVVRGDRRATRRRKTTFPQ